MKKLLLLTLLCTALLIAGCQRTDADAETTAPESGSPEADAIVIAADGASEYTIMRSDLKSDTAESEVAIALRRAIKAATGVELDIATDWNKEGNIPTDTKEILVGSTNRPESKAVLEGLGEDEYAIREIGGRIVINATSEDALVLAYSDFIKEHLGYDAEADTYSAKTLILPKELSMKGSYKLLVSLREDAVRSMTPDKYESAAYSLIDGVYYQKYDPWEVTGCLTSMQVNSAYSEYENVNCDSVMLYSTDPRTIGTWEAESPKFNIDMMIAINRADAEWSAAHPESIQTTKTGDQLHHTAGVSSYMVPTLEFIEYVWDTVEYSILQFNPVTIAFEEPEMWNSSGYSQGFKDEWKAYFGEAWQDPDSSPEALAKSMELKTYLFERIIGVMSERIKKIAPDTQLYIATHSTINYNAWNITAGLNHYMATDKVEGVIGQTWSDTVRSQYKYRGVGVVDEFLNAYVEYASYVDSVEGTNFYALADPMSDSGSVTEEQNRYAYLQTIVASMMHPEIHRFEICPWLSRAFGNVSGNYRTLLQQCFNALNEVGGKATTIEAGTPGIYFAVSDTISWLKNQKWAPATSDGFYGITMPLATAGIPVKIKSMEHINTAADLEDVKLLILSYDIMLPMSEKVNDAIAEWVKGGGTLLLASGKNEYWSADDRFWVEDGSPVANLFKKMGLDVKVNTDYSSNGAPIVPQFESELLKLKTDIAFKVANDRKFSVSFEGSVPPILKQADTVLGFDARVGSGRVVASGLASTTYGGSSEACALLKALVEYSLTSTGLEYVESNLMTARRGNVIATHAIADNDTLAGKYIDIYSTTLDVVTDPEVKGKNSRLLYDISNLDLSTPKVGFSGGVIINAEYSADKTVFTYTAASNSIVATRILAPKGSYPEEVTALCGESKLIAEAIWNNETSSLLLLIDGKADPSVVTVTWSGTPKPDSIPVEYVEDTVATNAYNEDEKYLVVNTAGANNGLRFCDLDLELIYKFDIRRMKNVKFSLLIFQNYIIEVSPDGENWTQVADYSQGGTVPHITTGANETIFVITPGEHGITEDFYLRISNSDPSQGWGGSIRRITWRYVKEDSAKENTEIDDTPYIVSEEGGVRSYKRTVHTNNKNLDADYLFENTAQANDTIRYADNAGVIVYKFDLRGTSDYEVAMTVHQNYLIEVSPDNENWTLVADFSEGGTLPHLTTGQNRTTIRVKAAEHDLSEDMYIRIANTDTSMGWGGSIAKFVLTYTRAK